MVKPQDQQPEDAKGSAEPGGKDGGKGPAQPITVGKAPKPLTQQVGRIAVVAAAAIFLLFALFNWQYVDFSWVFGKTEVLTQGNERLSGGVPLIVLLVVAFGLGAVVGAGTMHRRRRVKDARPPAKPKGK